MLAAGLRDPLRQYVIVVRPKQARSRATIAREQWQGDVLDASRAHPRQRFASPGRDVLLERLQREARTHDFDIVSVKLPRVPQLAPMVVVRTTHYVSLARAAYPILGRLDPYRGRRELPSHPRLPDYEGFYFEAQDEYGVPFFAVYDVAVPYEMGSGQWARSDPLKAALLAGST